MKSSTMIGGTGAHARHPSDFYATPAEVTRALIHSPAGMFLPHRVWEPACGDGAMAKVLLDDDFEVIATDLHDRGYGIAGVDFLKTLEMDCEWIATNPPFNLAFEFIRHALTFGVPVAMLLKGSFWHTAKAQTLFAEHTPAFVMPLTWRPVMVPERGKSPTMEFAWTVWLRPPVGWKRDCTFVPLCKPK